MAWSKRISDRASVFDTVALILSTSLNFSRSKVVSQVAASSKRSSNRLKYIFDFVCDNVSYLKDKQGHEIVTTPKRLLKDGKGDCKKMTTFISSILTNLNIRHYVKVISYDGINWRHIYVIVPSSDGGYITLDTVNKCKYDAELSHAKSMVYNQKGKLMTKLSLLGNIPNNSIDLLDDLMEDSLSIDSDLEAISGEEDEGRPNVDEGEGNDNEVEIYSLEGLGYYDGNDNDGLTGRRSKRRRKRAERRARRKARKAGRKARKRARKARKKAIRALPRGKQRRAARRKFRKERKANRKFARKTKKLGKSQGLPGALSKFIGKAPELFLAYFLKNNNPEVELTQQGTRKWNRVAKAIKKVGRKKGVSPAKILAFVDSTIERKYGVPAEEFAVAFTAARSEAGIKGLGIEPAVVTGIVAGVVALVGAVGKVVIGLNNKDINEADMPDGGDLTSGTFKTSGGGEEDKNNLDEWLEDAVTVFNGAIEVKDEFEKHFGKEPTDEEAEAIVAAVDQQVDKDNSGGGNNGKGMSNTTKLMLGGAVFFGLYQAGVFGKKVKRRR